jgi:hypothetical protein
MDIPSIGEMTLSLASWFDEVSGVVGVKVPLDVVGIGSTVEGVDVASGIVSAVPLLQPANKNTSSAQFTMRCHLDLAVIVLISTRSDGPLILTKAIGEFQANASCP